MIEGRRRNIGLGGYPVVTIEEARAVALDNRRKLRQGISPVKEKKAARVPTFKDMAARFSKTRAGQWSEQRAKMFSQIMDKHVLPVIGNRQVDRISQRDVLGILETVWTDKPHQAKRIKQFMRSVFDYAIAKEYTTANPAGDAIKAALPTVKTNGKNYRALPYADVPGAVRAIEDSVKTLNNRLCLLFTIYTGVRGQEARGAVWSEIDLKARTWTIPADRMKAGKVHRVPLNSAALDILEQAKAVKGNSDLVFPSLHQPGKPAPMTSAALNKGLQQAGLYDRTTAHGFRASFRTWAGEETDTPREVVEAALAHTNGDSTEQAYSRGDMFEKRRALMQSWADYLNA